MLIPLLLLPCKQGYRISVPGEFEPDVAAPNVQDAMDLARRLLTEHVQEEQDRTGRVPAVKHDVDELLSIGRQQNGIVCVIKVAP